MPSKVHGLAIVVLCLIVLFGINFYFEGQKRVVSFGIKEDVRHKSAKPLGRSTSTYGPHSSTVLKSQENVKNESFTTTFGTTQLNYQSSTLSRPQPIPPECICTDSHGTAHDFCYHLPENTSIHGRRFSCNHMTTMERLGLLNTSLIPFAIADISNPVFVTAFSSNHEKEAVVLMGTIAKHFPGQRMIAYNLGEINMDMFKNFSFVRFRDFNYSQYPNYVNSLNEYRWKPIVIAETLTEFGAIWYMDSSIVFKKGNLSHVYQLINCRNKISKRPPMQSVAERDQREKETVHESGWNVQQWHRNLAECRKAAYLFHGYTGHGIYPATSPEIYKFIPTNFTEIMKPKAKMYDAGMVLVAKTKDTMELILKWYVLCALEKGCMAGKPNEKIVCIFRGDRFSSPSTCHRYDQSVVNLLAANAFWYDRHYYVSEIVDFFNIVRRA